MRTRIKKCNMDVMYQNGMKMIDILIHAEFISINLKCKLKTLEKYHIVCQNEF
jgi:hypothetical protein